MNSASTKDIGGKVITDTRLAAVNRIGLDVGGTKIAAKLLSDDGELLGELRNPTPRDYDATVATIGDLVERVSDLSSQPTTVGIGIPGTIDPITGLVRNSNATWLNRRPLQIDLEAKLQRPLRMANDGECFTLSETIDGAAAGLDVVAGIVVGTGLGGGLTVHGRSVRGRHGSAAEWGHMPAPLCDGATAGSRPCFCGKSDCLETYVSGSALAQSYERATNEAVAGTEVAARAQEGDPAACHALEALETMLGRALAVIVAAVDPDAIVVGGGLSRIPGRVDRLPARLRSAAAFPCPHTRILAPRWGDASGARGAAWLWRS